MSSSPITPHSSPSKSTNHILSPMMSAHNNCCSNNSMGISPLSKSLLKTQIGKHSPTKSAYHIRSKTPSPTKYYNRSNKSSPQLGFTIWQDKPNSPTKEGNNKNSFPNLNHEDQENILQPKKLTSSPATKTSSTTSSVERGKRTPLGELSISQFKGYLTTQDEGTRQLCDLYQPVLYENEFGTAHKFTNLPGYLTPSRRNRRNSSGGGGISGSSGYLSVSNATLEAGRNSWSSRNHMVNKKTRSMSVGRNEAKRDLIKKGTFTIMTNTT